MVRNGRIQVNVICPKCGVIERSVSQQIGGKIAFRLAAAALGTRAAKNPLIVAICVVGGLALGHYMDQEVSKWCPQCGAILRIAGLLL
jgi:predicted RNA-binding Zn-ribbon protein involved in translation (DUF1610 family)